MCARPKSSSHAVLRVRTREPTHRKRLAAGVLTILWAIDRPSFDFGLEGSYTLVIYHVTEKNCFGSIKAALFLVHQESAVV